MEGSKIFVCEIGIDDVFSRMKDKSYYIGESLKSDPKYIELAAKLQASDDENPILCDFMSNSVTIISNILSSLIGETSYEKTDETILLTIRAKSNTPDYVENQLVDYITNYMSIYILTQWLDLINPNSSKTFEDSLLKLENEIRILSSRRTKPERP